MAEMFFELREKINGIVESWSTKLVALPVEVISERRNNQNRTIRQILGHLVDSAVNNHHRIVRLQYNENLEFPDYRQDNDRWIAIQNYQEEDWERLVFFWRSYNQHMVHIIKNVNESCLNHTWHDFEGNHETLRTIIEGYLWHLNLHLKEIQALIDG
ncbi:MAG: DinB family protein [Deltaproteobacteria bacterium]|nr:DinB family protein [Deltaproteobacteria bacterium]